MRRFPHVLKITTALVLATGIFAWTTLAKAHTSQDSYMTPLATNKPSPRPSKVLLPGAKWVPQSFNNCGPATTAMVLQYFGYQVSQDETKQHLRTSPDDANVFMYEIQNYLASDYNIKSKLLYNGTPEKLKVLLSNGFYILIEDELHPGDDIGHFVTIRGYDDEKGVFIFDDSYLGNDTTHTYDEFNNGQWKPFNREYAVLYKPEQEALVKKLIGDDWDEKTMYLHAVTKAKEEVASNPHDAYAYFNLGSDYFGLHEYAKAGEAYSTSQKLGWPKHMLWYQIKPVQTQNKLGNYQKALDLSDLGLWANDSFAELHLEKALAYKGLGNKEKARDEAQKALLYAPTLKEAQALLASL